MSETTFDEILAFGMPILLIDNEKVSSSVSKSIGFDGKIFKILVYNQE